MYPSPLDRLPVAPLHVTLRARERLVLDHASPGNVLRGAFGLAFRRLACPDPAACADRCRRPRECPYAAVFEPTPPPGSARLAKNQDLPRPFVFRFPPTAPAEVAPGGTLEFGLTLIGRAAQAFPWFVVALRELGARGMGRYRGRFDLAAIDCAGERVFAGEDVRMLRPVMLTACALGSRATLEFKTPVLLKEGGAFLERPRFGALVKRARDRANALATFFGEGPLEADFREIGERADLVRCVDDRTERVDVRRWSFRQHAWHDLGGFVGRATFAGDLAPFAPWLTFAQAIHVGKHASFGNGWVEVAAEA